MNGLPQYPMNGLPQYPMNGSPPNSGLEYVGNQPSSFLQNLSESLGFSSPQKEETLPYTPIVQEFGKQPSENTIVETTNPVEQTILEVETPPEVTEETKTEVEESNTSNNESGETKRIITL